MSSALPSQRCGWKVPALGGPGDGQVLDFPWPEQVPEGLSLETDIAGIKDADYELEITKRGPRFVYVGDADAD